MYKIWYLEETLYSKAKSMTLNVVIPRTLKHNLYNASYL